MKLYKKIRIFFLVVILIQANNCLYGSVVSMEQKPTGTEIVANGDAERILPRFIGMRTRATFRNGRGTVTTTEIKNFQELIETLRKEQKEQLVQKSQGRTIALMYCAIIVAYVGWEAWQAYKQLSDQERKEIPWSKMPQAIAVRTWNNIKRRPQEIINYAK